MADANTTFFGLIGNVGMIAAVVSSMLLAFGAFAVMDRYKIPLGRTILIVVLLNWSGAAWLIFLRILAGK